MLGGLLYELLTAGHVPYHWLLGNTELLRARLVSAAPVPILGAPGPGAAGLKGKNVLEAAVIDGVAVPWKVRIGASPASTTRLDETKALVEACLRQDPAARPKLDALSSSLEHLCAGEPLTTEPSGGAPSDPAPRPRVDSLYQSANTTSYTAVQVWGMCCIPREWVTARSLALVHTVCFCETCA